MRYSIQGLGFDMEVKGNDWKGGKINGNLNIHIDKVECEISTEELKNVLEFYRPLVEKLLKEVISKD